MNRKRIIRFSFVFLLLAFLLYGGCHFYKKNNFNRSFKVGQPIDSLHHVVVYYNGGVGNVSGRHLSPDGYNIGLKYQCVEFVKRYYYERFQHKMPDSYGHAKDFFDPSVPDAGKNERRGLFQFHNSSSSPPQEGDILVFKGTLSNRFGHVAIISKVEGGEVEIIQQNPGPFGKSRVSYALSQTGGAWGIENKRVLGWLGKRVGE